ncbi:MULTISPECIES: GntR family transcriptional regulator [Brevibacillus]|jgi:DNA-binding transcriptional regulator YhcF (GntR family)|uniref:HTH gntR-type domain-containing protein n=1 Tax=Brevibacillus parabrevis TaxID=54914 RepID=A0A4Y3PGR9_BREPA|nr:MULTISPECIES: GntR family transcriptional regulator [Brevibacillus]MDH6349791.1 DNA-binding transcriptional regulator YhcF (GntR family) [Brevibacillus sp. 1238]MDR4999243.1 GntR family transcriptional regulator [Brevibacillus parabrevis]MED2254197.1 GntR family transcriptional regulator [Brevibacillus parabrevis]NRQ56643.1 GntR family transcriptional regulator [Brevibacillus sp. HD1.4A]RNB94131.1 GntR family transcriptional regulator [Brevibacillus parabrevis]
MLRLTLQKDSNVSYHEQIYQQIASSIRSGELPPNEQLPTVRELAAQLKVNYNTVRSVYLRLQQEGMVDSRQGRGTIVSNIVNDPLLTRNPAHLALLAKETLHKVKAMGYSMDEFTRVLSCVMQEINQFPVLFLRFTELELAEYLRLVQYHLPSVMLEGRTFEDFSQRVEQDPSFLQQYKAIVTHPSVNLRAKHRLPREAPPVVSLDFIPDPTTVIPAMEAYPRHTKVGLVCATIRGAAGMINDLYNAGITHLDIRTIEANHPDVFELITNCDVVYISKPGYMVRPHLLTLPKVKEYQEIPDHHGINELRKIVTQ